MEKTTEKTGLLTAMWVATYRISMKNGNRVKINPD